MVFTFVMNSSLASDKGKAKKNERCYTCPHCKKAFDNHQALGGHIEAHQAEVKQQKIQSHVCPPYNSLDGTDPNPRLGEALNNPCVSEGKEISPPKFTNFPYSYETSMLKAANCCDSNARDANNSLVMPLNYSTTTNINATLNPLVQFDGTMAFGLPVDHPRYTSSSGIPLYPASNASSMVNRHLNVGNQQSFVPGLYIPFGEFSPYIQHHDYNDLPCPSFVTNAPFPSYHHINDFSGSPNVFPGVDMNAFRSQNMSSVADPLSSVQTHSLSPCGHNDNHKNRDQVGETVNKRNSDAVQENTVTMNSPKRPRIKSIPAVGCEEKILEKKEILLSEYANLEILPEDAVNRASTSEIANDVKAKDEDDLDLSLHL